jgi:hypothetical protein
MEQLAHQVGQERQVDGGAEDPDPRTSWWAQRWRWLVGGVLLVTVAIGVSALGSTWRHPHAFQPDGGFAVGLDRARVGQTEYAGLVYEATGAHGSITIRDVRPLVVSDTTDSEIEFFVCHLRAGSIGGVGVIGEEDIKRDCATIAPAEGATLQLNAEPHEQLLVAVTPQHAGVVAIKGVAIRYTYGWRNGSQKITGGSLRMRVKVG